MTNFYLAAESDVEAVSDDGVATDNDGNLSHPEDGQPPSEEDREDNAASDNSVTGAILVSDPNNDGAQGIICSRCHTFNVFRAAGEPAYVITVGLQVGVFTDWYVLFLWIHSVRLWLPT